MPKYPEVVVELVGTDSNAFSIIGRCSAVARRAGLSSEEIKQFQAEATAGDYADLLMICSDWFTTI